MCKLKCKIGLYIIRFWNFQILTSASAEKVYLMLSLWDIYLHWLLSENIKQAAPTEFNLCIG